MQPHQKHAVQALTGTFTFEDFHIKIPFLPAGHPEQCPTDQLWSKMKREAVESNFSLKLSELEEAVRTQIS